MSISTTYNYNVPGNFVYDNTKIQVTGSLAQLLIGNAPGLTFTQNYSSSTGFTFSSTFTEFTGGVARQKDNRPSGFLAYYAWTSALGGSGLDGNYGTTTVGVSAFGGVPTVTGGFLDLTGSSNKSVVLANASTYGLVNIGTLAFRFKPNYSGAPAVAQYLVASAAANGSLTNYFALRHVNGTAHLFVEVYSSGGVGIGTLTNLDIGAFSPTAGTTYDFVFQLDVTNGATKLFINGVQLGTTNASTGTRTAPNVMNVGHDTFGVGATSPEMSFKNLSLYNVVVAPANCFLLQDNIYMADTVTLPTFSYPGPAGHIQSWTSLAITDTNGPKYSINSLYWNGSAWVSSDGTYAQSASSALTIANIATLPVSDTVVVKAAWQASNTTQMSADNWLLTYVGQSYPTTDPSIVPAAGIPMDTLFNFVTVSSASGSDGVQFYLTLDSAPKYWNGSAWVTSDTTYAQTNSAATILANVGSLPISLGASVKAFALLHSATGATTPTLTSLSLTYNYFDPKPTGPNICQVFGYIVDVLGNPIVGAKLHVTNPAYFNNQGLFVAPTTVSATSTSIGYVDMNLEETATVGVALNWSVVYPAGTTVQLGASQVPNAVNQNLALLTFS